MQCVVIRDSGTFTITERAEHSEARHNLTLSVYDAAGHRDHHHVTVTCHVVTSDYETVYRTVKHTFSDYGATFDYSLSNVVRDVMADHYGDNVAVYVQNANATVSDDARGIVSINVSGYRYQCIHESMFEGPASSHGLISPFAKHSHYDGWAHAEGVNIRDGDDGVWFTAAIMFHVAADDTIVETSHQ